VEAIIFFIASKSRAALQTLTDAGKAPVGDGDEEESSREEDSIA
jgi:hypothetical protein